MQQAGRVLNLATLLLTSSGQVAGAARTPGVNVLVCPLAEKDLCTLCSYHQQLRSLQCTRFRAIALLDVDGPNVDSGADLGTTGIPLKDYALSVIF